MLDAFVVQASRLHDSTTFEEVRARRPHHNIVGILAITVHLVWGEDFWKLVAEPSTRFVTQMTSVCV